MNITRLTDIKNNGYKKAEYALNTTFRDSDTLTKLCVAYVISKASAITGSDLSSFESFLSSCSPKAQVVPVLMEKLSACWENIVLLSEKQLDDEMLSYLMFVPVTETRIRNEHTPECISILASKVLDIQPEYTVADFCTGGGAFIRDTVISGVSGRFFGFDTNPVYRTAAAMRCDILDTNIMISGDDVLKLDRKFDRIFSHFPFNMRFEGTTSRSSGDWIFAEKLVSSLSENGKAACLMTNGCMWNHNDSKMRKHFVDNRYIESVIALPDNTLEDTAVGIVMVILSHNNDKVNFVDATEIYTAERRKKRFSAENIDEIIGLLNNKNTLVSCDKIADESYNLYPKTYTEIVAPSDETVPFSEYITKITRGAQVKSSELDSLVTDEKTDYQLLMLSDIKNGTIPDNLPYIKQPEKRLEKYMLSNQDIVITKNGLPVKSAVAKISDESHILVNGNLYIVSVDTEKVNPYYLKAFFESEQGSSLLKSISVGATIPNIPIDALKHLPIPVRTKSEQDRIADRFIRKLKETESLRQRLAESEQQLKECFK